MSFLLAVGERATGLLVAVTMGTDCRCLVFYFFRADCVSSHLSSHFPALPLPLPLPLAFPSPLSFSPRCRFAAVGVFLVGPVGASCAASGCFLSDLSVCLVPLRGVSCWTCRCVLCRLLSCCSLQLAVPNTPGVADVWRLHWEAELVKLNEDMEVSS